MSWMGVAGLPEEAVPANAEGAVNGDPHGADLGEGISQVLRIHPIHCSEWLLQEGVPESLCPSRSTPSGLFSLATLDEEANPWSWLAQLRDALGHHCWGSLTREEAQSPQE